MFNGFLLALMIIVRWSSYIHRKLLNLSQKELAEKVYVTPQNLSKWENGLSNPDIWNLCRIAGVLDLSCDYLLGRGAIKENKQDFLAVP